MTFVRRPKKKTAITLRMVVVYIIGLLIIMAGVFLSTLSPVGPLPEALPYLQSTSRVQVQTGSYTWFQPAQSAAKTGFIFYPGGRVDYRSYAPLCASLAEKGWPVALVPMPLDLAILGPDKASGVIKDHPEINRWVIAGHSLGGTMAAQFTTKNSSSIAGIIFLASYPADKSLATSSLPMLAIFGEKDGLVTEEDREKYRPRFPEFTEWMVIEGGNHAGFGRYGEQEGDYPATISLQDQEDQVLQAVDHFLKKIDNTK